MLILELRASSAFVLPTRLFIRHKGKEAYEQIGSPAEDVSYESPVTCEGFPVVVFNSIKRAKTGGELARDGTAFRYPQPLSSRRGQRKNRASWRSRRLDMKCDSPLPR